MTFTITYHCKFELKNAPNYKFTSRGKCFNSKTGREIKMILKGSTKGFIINGKFRSIKTLRKQLQLIERVKCPF